MTMKNAILIILWLVLMAACLGALPAESTEKPTFKQVVTIRVIVTAQTEVGVYRDSLCFTVDDPRVSLADFLAAKQPEIDKTMQARVADHVNRIKHPPAPVEPTKEMLEQELAEVERQKESLDARKVELTARIAAKTVWKDLKIEEMP
jgi:hypothetical protein